MVSRVAWGLAGLLALAGCAPAPIELTVGKEGESFQITGVPLTEAAQATPSFRQVVARVMPVAERACRNIRGAGQCGFSVNSVQVLEDPKLPPNALQTEDNHGRPAFAFTQSLLEQARNPDELAFILGHEAAHHILGHVERTNDSALHGTLLAGVLAAVAGEDEKTVDEAQRAGMFYGARRYSKDYELEADRLGTLIAYLAGYDPIAGIAYFQRVPDPGNKFLGSHPPNAQRIATVRDEMAKIQASQ